MALACGVNANLRRRWVREAELLPVKALRSPAPALATLVPVQLLDPVASNGDLRLELRRGVMTITLAWPMAAAAECASGMRELLW